MDKGAAARFWGVKVGRCLLMQSAEGVTYDFANRAFGGLGQAGPHEIEGEDDNSELEASVVEASIDGGSLDGSVVVTRPFPGVQIEDGSEVGEDNEDDENENDLSEQEASDSDDDQSEEGNAAERILMRRARRFDYSSDRASLNVNVPYSSHTKVYKGHCNSRTVKDVNYYGLNDEYVVSGSDDGHFFIWDRKTTKIVNILEGDGEVVNVVQGHPYEPMIACSGIDSTVKIFGPGGDSREREAAERGIDIANPGVSTHSSLRGSRWLSRRTQPRDNDSDEDEENAMSANGLSSRRRLHRSYEITSQNDVNQRMERRWGADDTFITVSELEQMIFGGG
jgi:nuclear receptor interaction protein